MRSGRIERTESARRDLLSLWAYIATESSRAADDRMVGRLESALGKLAENPLMGPPRPELAFAPRSWVVRPYVILYEPLPGQRGILLRRVIHSARDIPGLVGRGPP